MGILLERILRREGRAFYTDNELRLLLTGTSHSQKSIIKRAVRAGLLIRLRRGLYCVSEEITQKKPHAFELAQFIYGPSCISLESALSYHDLIPEAVYTTTSVTINRNKTFTTPLGEYDFHKVPTKDFLLGVDRMTHGEAIFFIASPWRALADCVFCYKKHWESLTALENDLRLSIENLPKITESLAKALKKYYHNKRVDTFLNKSIKGYLDGS